MLGGNNECTRIPVSGEIGTADYRATCFGISPNRTIWHTWPGAGGWKLMPGNGHADDTGTAFAESAAGSRIVSVWVYGGTGNWCQNYSRRRVDRPLVRQLLNTDAKRKEPVSALRRPARSIRCTQRVR